MNELKKNKTKQKSAAHLTVSLMESSGDQQKLDLKKTNCQMEFTFEQNVHNVLCCLSLQLEMPGTLCTVTANCRV